MSRQYNNPPIETAVCEFRFPPTKPWDLVVPGLMYTKLSNDFPIRLPARRGQGVNIQLGPEGVVSQQVVDQLPQLIDASRTRVDIPYADERDSLRLNLSAPSRSVEEPLVVTLDLDYSLVEPGGVEFDEVTTWLEHAHDQIEAVFEGCLKEPLREMFDAGSN